MLRRLSAVWTLAILITIPLTPSAGAICFSVSDCVPVFNPCLQTFCIVGQCIDLPVNCNDNNGCTVDRCDPLSIGCIHEPYCSQDGLVCNGEEFCLDLGGPQCLNGSALDCDDGNACTGDACTEPSGCTHVSLDCNDGDLCTTDGCDPASGCTHASVAGCCRTSGDCAAACTTGRSCVGGTCTGGAPRDCDDGNPCTADSCDPAAGCVSAALPGCCRDDADCTSDACTGGGRCVGRVCVAGAPPTCDDGDACTDDSCVTGAGCQHAGKSGFAALACICERTLPSVCADDVLPKSIRKRHARACGLIARAADAKAKKLRRLLGRATALLRRVQRKTEKGVKGLDETCATALSDRFTDDHRRAEAFREAL